MAGDRLRVVLDANVFVAGAIARGAPNRLVDLWLSGSAPFDVIVCPALIDEVSDVLARPRLRKWIRPGEADGFVRLIRTVADVVRDPEPTPGTTRDPDDDYLVALARSHTADWIVTGDHDLLNWPEQQPPAIGPSEFLRLLEDRTGL